MSFADLRSLGTHSARWFQSRVWRYPVALGAVCLVAFLRNVLTVRFGSPHGFLFFLPTVVLAALLDGFWLGLFTTTLCALLAWNFPLQPLNSFAVSNVVDKVGIIVFVMTGTMLSAVSERFRRRTMQLQGFQQAVEGVEEMIAVIDRNYRYLSANDAFLKARGMKREEVVGHCIGDILDREVFESSIKQKIEDCFRGKIVQYELLYKYPTNGERNLLLTYLPIEGANGIDRVAAVIQDVTERKRSQNSLQLFRTLMDESNDSVQVIDPETLRILDINEKACRELGYTRSELLSMTVRDIDANPDAAHCQAIVDRLKQGEPLVVQTVCRRKDGSTIPVETSLKYVQFDRSYVIAVSRNISERVIAEAALRESEDRYRDLVEHSEDLVCTHDLEGRLLSVNPAPARILGYEPEELLQIPMRELIVSEYRYLFDAYLDRIKANGTDKGLLVVQSRSGETRTWEYNNTLRTQGVAAPIVRGMAHDITERRRAELSLRDSEQRYRQLFEKNLAGVVTSTLQGHIADCNDAGARMLGYDNAEQVRGLNASDFYVDPGARGVLLEELKHTQSVYSREVQLKRRDGTPVWALFNSILSTKASGEQVVQSTLIDISARKRALEGLQRREDDYRRFVERSSEGIFREDPDAPIPIDLPEEELIHRILYGSYVAECNDAMAGMYGFASSRDLIGKRVAEMVIADDPNNIEMTREYVRSGFRVLERESHEVDSHGRPKVFRTSMIGIVEDGSLLRTWGIQRDVTEQVRLETARVEAVASLRKSEEHFRILVEQASDGIYVVDSQGRFLDTNTVGSQMLGYSREELLELSIANVVAESDTGRVPPIPARLAAGAIVRSDWMVRRKDGSVFPGEMCAKQLPDGHLQGILRDVTERKKAEEEMRRSEERFRVALKDSPITVFNQDRNLRYTWIYNAQLYLQKEVLGMSDEEILGIKRAATLTALKHKVLTTGLPAREEVVLQHDGTRFAFDLSIEPLFDAQGSIIGITGACMDIARLRELADRLQDSRDRLEEQKSYLETEIRSELGFAEIIGRSRSLDEVLKKTRIVAPTDSTVLLLGETGTGKELVARSVHSLSARRDKTFVKLNCAAVPSGLLESELFGHEKGAFTGAVSQKIGRIELADKGTLFLDEIGELPSELQPKLLRVLQDREFERLGSVHTLKVDVRIISATNRDLYHDVVDKKFREDLYYRLNVFPIHLPPLRDRREDIPMLVRHFVEKHAQRMGKHIDTIPDGTMCILQNWKWPGNVRELENMIERMIILTKGRILAAPPAELQLDLEVSSDDLSEMERQHIIHVLRDTNGVLAGSDGAAARLGLKRTTLQSMLKRFGIEATEFRRRNGADY